MNTKSKKAKFNFKNKKSDLDNAEAKKSFLNAEMKPYKPSLPLVVMLIVTICVVSSLIFYKDTIAKKFAANPASNSTTENAEDADKDGLPDEKEKELGTNPSLKDSDGDGLKDGEEVNTYKTNPLEPDTDKDGYNDQLEVLKGYDPLVRAEEEAKKREAQVKSSEVNVLNQMLNEDDPANVDLSKIDPSSLLSMGNLMNLGTASQEVVITDSDIVISDDDSREAVRAYIDHMGLIFAKRSPSQDEDGFSKYINKVMEGEFQVLDDFTSVSPVAFNEVSKVPVPKSLVKFHKQVLEIMANGETFMKNMSKAKSEPTYAIVALAQMDKVWQDLYDFQQEANSISLKYDLGFGQYDVIPNPKVEQSKK